jgi:hypothetical protein
MSLCLHIQGVDIDNDMLIYACAGLAVDPNSPETVAAVAARAAAASPAEADAAGAKHHHHHHHHRHLLQASSDSLDYRWKVSTTMLQALKGRVRCRGGDSPGSSTQQQQQVKQPSNPMSSSRRMQQAFHPSATHEISPRQLSADFTDFTQPHAHCNICQAL